MTETKTPAEQLADKTFSVLLDTEDDVIEMKARLIRIEVRLCKLLVHMGLNYDGSDVPEPVRLPSIPRPALANTSQKRW